jgi:hypothetical protein
MSEPQAPVSTAEPAMQIDSTSRTDGTQILIPTPGNPQAQEMVQVAPSTAAIYFTFLEDESAEDKASTPNKLVLGRPNPSVAELLSTLKALFFPLQDVTLTAAFAGADFAYSETSNAPVPVNDRTNVVTVSVKLRCVLPLPCPYSFRFRQRFKIPQHTNPNSTPMASVK